MRVFISYASEDRDIAEKVQLALAGDGNATFFDTQDLPAGGDYNARIAAGIEQCDALVFLVSPYSVVPGSFALTELKLARSRWAHPAGRVVPVRIAPVSFEQMPNYLKAVTILEPEGNVALEVVMAVRALRQALGASGTDGPTVPAPVNVPLPPTGGPNAKPYAGTAAARWGWAVAAAVGVALAIWLGPQALEPRPGVPVPAHSSASAAASGAVAHAAGPASGAIERELAPPLLPMWRCTTRASGPASNPLANRAAEVDRPPYSVDTRRHLLLDSERKPVSIAAATSLGALSERRLIVVHFSGAPAESAAAYFAQPEAASSVHVMISRDGQVRQLLPFDFAAHHAGVATWRGIGSLNSRSIAIDLENLGVLARKEGRWVAWTGNEVPAADVVTATESSATGWHRYTEAQLRSFLEVACSIRDAYPSIEEIVGHDQISPGRKTDPGPAFPLRAMQLRIFGRPARP